MCHEFALFIVCSLPSFPVLFKVLWSAVLACTDPSCWNVGWPTLKRRRRGTVRKKRGTSDRVRGRDGAGGWGGGVCGGGVSRGSEWLECTLRLGEWAACWAGGYCRYCVEAAGVTVAVTDTKTTFHGRRHWLKAVARPLHANHTLSINNHSFLWWIVYYWPCFFFFLVFFFFLLFCICLKEK